MCLQCVLQTSVAVIASILSGTALYAAKSKDAKQSHCRYGLWLVMREIASSRPSTTLRSGCAPRNDD